MVVRGAARGVESRGGGWLTTGQGGAGGTKEPGRASGITGHGGGEGARTQGGADGSKDLRSSGDAEELDRTSGDIGDLEEPPRISLLSPFEKFLIVMSRDQLQLTLSGGWGFLSSPRSPPKCPLGQGMLLAHTPGQMTLEAQGQCL